MNTTVLQRSLLAVPAWVRMTVFLLKVFPMLPSRPVDWCTGKPVIEKVTFPVLHGNATADLYRPSGKGRHPAIVVCLGVVPFGTDHPQVPRLGEALARAGFAALLYWSPAMRDLRLSPDDTGNISLAYQWLVRQPFADPGRSGLLGTCVGGSFSLMAAASPCIRDKVSFVAAYAPFHSLLTLLLDAASSTTIKEKTRGHWNVDPLTRKVLVRCLTEDLGPSESRMLREAFSAPEHPPAAERLSRDATTICSLLSHPDVEEARELMRRMPDGLLHRLDAMSPARCVKDIHAPLVLLLHDVGDTVIPVGESRQLHSSLQDYGNARYRELNFQHLDPSKLPVRRLFIELIRFCKALYPLFQTKNRIKPQTGTPQALSERVERQNVA